MLIGSSFEASYSSSHNRLCRTFYLGIVYFFIKIFTLKSNPSMRSIIKGRFCFKTGIIRTCMQYHIWIPKKMFLEKLSAEIFKFKTDTLRILIKGFKILPCNLCSHNRLPFHKFLSDFNSVTDYPQEHLTAATSLHKRHP